jgi:hypothetical protein
VALADSTTALTDIMSNPDVSKCPDKCFRPVGLAWDSKGRLWMASDSTGEIYVLQKGAGTPTSSASGTIVTETGAPSAAAALWNLQTMYMSCAAVVAAAFLAF